MTILRYRVVDQGESDLYPGSYVGHPITFVQHAGDAINQWGILDAKQDRTALHTSRKGDTPTSTLNYFNVAVNSTILHALELLDKQNQVIVVCGKSRSGLPAIVTSTLLSMPFEPAQVVPLVRPHSSGKSFHGMTVTSCSCINRIKTGVLLWLRRDQLSVNVSTVPKVLLALLPKQGDKSMCMRYLSKKGCSGPAPGTCFDPSRAHCKPLSLPADAKDCIDKHFQGLASKFQDL
ncbi:hypothetical protein PHMEG_0005455 [Phytophthora megakarya]|uniref:Uncharacterized protein n=1 Tax=Phytophthora megakarya TaxID=4795 RepID=A0A225WRG4_9STRA|nr:hypothetical protein PHMEG_0005455 [Phytophthora megakarya]